MKTILASFILFLFAAISLYFGIAGYTRIEIERNIEIAKKEDKENDIIVSCNTCDGVINAKPKTCDAIKKRCFYDRIFPFQGEISDGIYFLIIACFFGMLGGTCNIIKKIVLNKTIIYKSNYISIPLLSFFSGIIIVGISILLPNLLFSLEGAAVRPQTLIFFSFFSGLFIEEFYIYLTKISNQLFNNKSKKEPHEN